MLQDKAMVNDALASIKSSLTNYANTIDECYNPQLRSAIQQIRNNCENSQYELYHLASSKGFYTPAALASDTEEQKVKSQLTGS